MKNYADLCQKILDKGYTHGNRTGVDATRLFGEQLRFDMAEGFPLMTTKKVPLRWVFEELMWFLRGETNERTLSEKGVDIWKEWAGEDGHLGPIYGKQMRLLETTKFMPPILISEPAWYCQAISNLEMTDFSEFRGEEKAIYDAWSGMLRRCLGDTEVPPDEISEAATKHDWVCERWLTYENFRKDFKKIPGWEGYLAYTYLAEDKRSRMVTCERILSPTQAATNYYHPDTVQFESARVYSFNKTNLGIFLSKTESWTMFYEEEHALQILDRRERQALKSAFCSSPGDQVAVMTDVDPLADVLAQLQHNPQSRRLVVDMWNPLEGPEMALEPCHMMFQFDACEPGKLSLSMYQRSADVFLGVPFNIASYAMLLQLVAHYTGRQADQLVITFGNVHVYGNHVEQVNKQLSREPRALPKVKINRKPTGRLLEDILETKWEDLELIGYDPHPKIAAPVAV